MSIGLLALDAAGLLFAALGFTLAFRQNFVRRLLAQRGAGGHADPASISQAPSQASNTPSGDQDALTYGLRIVGVMLMIFSLALCGLLSLFALES